MISHVLFYISIYSEISCMLFYTIKKLPPTLAKEVILSVLSVCVSVYLSVCLCSPAEPPEI